MGEMLVGFDWTSRFPRCEQPTSATRNISCRQGEMNYSVFVPISMTQ